jgi:hypothetical protein
MGAVQAFFFGMLVAWVPSLLLLLWMGRTADAELSASDWSQTDQGAEPCPVGQCDHS